MTSPTWPFSAEPALAAALTLMSEAASIGNGRFPARNFRLEKQISPQRVKNYAGIVRMAGGLTDAAAASDQLEDLHRQYLNNYVNIGTRVEKFNPTSTNCPESFRTTLHLDEFGHSEDDLFLVRVEDLDSIANRTRTPRNEIRDIANDIATSNRDGVGDKAKWEPLTYILQSWHDILDNRPVFATYWEDAQSVLADPKPGWAEELRDRLGLVHYEPAQKSGGEMDVIVFRYPVRLIPRLNRTGPRMLLRPTVLDSRLSQAFCTAPAGGGVGSALDLAGRDDDPWREVIHPPVELKPEHIWAADTLTASPPADLATSRALHIIKLCHRASPDFQELCNAVDRDLM